MAMEGDTRINVTQITHEHCLLYHGTSELWLNCQMIACRTEIYCLVRLLFDFKKISSYNNDIIFLWGSAIESGNSPNLKKKNLRNQTIMSSTVRIPLLTTHTARYTDTPSRSHDWRKRSASASHVTRRIRTPHAGPPVAFLTLHTQQWLSATITPHISSVWL